MKKAPFRLAIFSFEYFKDTAYSGIATYTHRTSNLLAEAGHHVEIFVASKSKRQVFTNEHGVKINPIICDNPEEFRKLVVKSFKKRHQVVNFTLLESPEYQALALNVVQEFPDLPLIVRLHTPGFFLSKIEMEYYKLSLFSCFKQRLKKLLGKNSVYQYIREHDIEYQITKLATVALSPSQDLANILRENWQLNNIDVLPHAFVPNKELLDIPIETDTKTISFVGKMQYWKGVFILIEVIKKLLPLYPDWNWRLIGRTLPGQKLVTIEKELQQIVPTSKRVEYVGMIDNKDLSTYLEETDIVVIPSYFDNFPLVCLEAMAAGRAIVATNHGGMREMLQGDSFRAGILIEPRSEVALETAIKSLIENPKLRYKLGQSARERIIDYYDRVVKKETLKIYQ
ncbi:MAG: glycosyltransferase family 4 protein, partial [Pseudomonadales bacterium]|nr:glycosyltransferase family 4 protein [Pseudomonadales bacterium]